MHTTKQRSIDFGGISFNDLQFIENESISDHEPREKLKLPGNALSATFPKTCPYKSISDYRASKRCEKHERYTTKYEIAKSSPSVNKLHAKKVLKEKLLLLDRYRKFAKSKTKLFNKQWNQIEKMQLTFKAQFLKFNTFIKENQEKRERALKKIADEKELQVTRNLNAEIMQEDLQKTTAIKNLMETKIKAHRIYEDYLNEVVRSSIIHKNVNEILYRYESLIETRNYLSIKEQQDYNALQNAQSNMAKLMEEKKLVLVGLQNMLSSLQARYNLAYAKSLEWETIVSKVQDTYYQQISKIDMVRGSIDFMFTDMCKRKNWSMNLNEQDYESKLIFIKKNLLELCYVASKLKTINCNISNM